MICFSFSQAFQNNDLKVSARVNAWILLGYKAEWVHTNLRFLVESSGRLPCRFSSCLCSLQLIASLFICLYLSVWNSQVQFDLLEFTENRPHGILTLVLLVLPHGSWDLGKVVCLWNQWNDNRGKGKNLAMDWRLLLLCWMLR